MAVAAETSRQQLEWPQHKMPMTSFIDDLCLKYTVFSCKINYKPISWLDKEYGIAELVQMGHFDSASIV